VTLKAAARLDNRSMSGTGNEALFATPVLDERLGRIRVVVLPVIDVTDD
jgi:hypothetical protein